MPVMTTAGLDGTTPADPMARRRAVLQLLRQVSPFFPAWLDLTVLNDELRLHRGDGGTVSAQLRRRDRSLESVLLPAE